MDPTPAIVRCCYCGAETLQLSHPRGAVERLVTWLGDFDAYRCGECSQRFAAAPLHSGRRPRRRRKRRSLEQRLEAAPHPATPRWALAVAVLVTTVVVLLGLIWAERGFAPFSTPGPKRAPAERAIR